MSSRLTGKNHRIDFQTCPHCGTMMEYRDWDNTAVRVVTRVIFGKHDSGAIVSACPICGEESWVHDRLESMASRHSYDDHFKKSWSNRAEKELKKRRIEAARKLQKSLCAGCTKLEDITCNTSTYRVCSIGMGPTTEECDKYEPC